ncbi:SHOCT domain-containing protein [Halococcus qingdaonensis]|uniref:SHOCT domain-containing protein n=1 Tax=Halococcus qingdaonensis TaxID=224402 RepID=UPI002115F51F|nr:SHOCT domain-containing protein [Halococcus qingdaonensis]
MGWLRRHSLAISSIVLLVSSVLLAVVLGYAGLVAYSGLAAGTALASVLTELAVPYLPIVALLLVLVVVSGTVATWSALRRLSIPRSERFGTAAERIEQRYPAIDGLGISEFVSPPEPTTEDALADLKRRYVAGELDEAAFERKLDRLVANESVDDVRAERERRAVLDESSNGSGR